jgi:transcriptional regulator with XRE-family HTH domain
MNNVQETLSRLLAERKMSQAELARRSGVGRNYINQLMNGRVPNITLGTAVKLASGLGVSPSVFFGYDGALDESQRVDFNRYDVPVYKDFPFHAGAPVSPQEYVPMLRDRNPDQRREGYYVRGTCLMPDIHDGDLIIVHRDGQIDLGDIVACLCKGELHLGRLRKIADELFLENNDGRMKLDECTVAAPVVEVRRKIK